jgi:hypothetical protein
MKEVGKSIGAGSGWVSLTLLALSLVTVLKVLFFPLDMHLVGLLIEYIHLHMYDALALLLSLYLDPYDLRKRCALFLSVTLV